MDQLVHSKAMAGRQGLAASITNKVFGLVVHCSDVVAEVVPGNEPFRTEVAAVLSDVEMNNVGVLFQIVLV